MSENSSFEYTYSAREQDEIRRIREKYALEQKNEISTLERLRELDRGVYKKAAACSIALGVLGALLLGTGMSLFMTELGELLGSYSDLAMPAGIVLGLVGICLVVLAHPVYNAVVRRERLRITPEIIRLSDELMK